MKDFFIGAGIGCALFFAVGVTIAPLRHAECQNWHPPLTYPEHCHDH